MFTGNCNDDGNHWGQYDLYWRTCGWQWNGQIIRVKSKNRHHSATSLQWSSKQSAPIRCSGFFSPPWNDLSWSPSDMFWQWRGTMAAPPWSQKMGRTLDAVNNITKLRHKNNKTVSWIIREERHTSFHFYADDTQVYLQIKSNHSCWCCPKTFCT